MRHDYEEPEEQPLSDDDVYPDDWDYYDHHDKSGTWDDLWIEDGPASWLIVLCRPTGMIAIQRGEIKSFTCSQNDYMFDVFVSEDVLERY